MCSCRLADNTTRADDDAGDSARSAVAGQRARHRCSTRSNRSAPPASRPKRSTAPSSRSSRPGVGCRGHEPDRHRAERMGSPRATGGCTSCTATASHRSRRGRAGRRADVPAAQQPHGRRVHPDGQAERVAIPEHARTSQALLADYKGRTAIAAGEVFDATPANIEARVQRLDLPRASR